MLENFARWRHGAPTKMPNPGDIGKSLRYAIEYMKAPVEIVREPESDGWVSVEDALPLLNDDFFDHCSPPLIVCTPGEVIDNVKYMEFSKRFASDPHGRHARNIDNVTHWRYLPKPPTQ